MKARRLVRNIRQSSATTDALLLTSKKVSDAKENEPVEIGISAIKNDDKMEEQVTSNKLDDVAHNTSSFKEQVSPEARKPDDVVVNNSSFKEEIVIFTAISDVKEEEEVTLPLTPHLTTDDVSEKELKNLNWEQADTSKEQISNNNYQAVIVTSSKLTADDGDSVTVNKIEDDVPSGTFPNQRLQEQIGGTERPETSLTHDILLATFEAVPSNATNLRIDEVESEMRSSSIHQDLATVSTNREEKGDQNIKSSAQCLQPLSPTNTGLTALSDAEEYSNNEEDSSYAEGDDSDR